MSNKTNNNKTGQKIHEICMYLNIYIYKIIKYFGKKYENYNLRSI